MPGSEDISKPEPRSPEESEVRTSDEEFLDD